MSVNKGTVLIASVSARALVEAARRSGFSPYAVDFFADEDLREAACGWRKMPGPIDNSFQELQLLDALSDLAKEAGEDIVGVVCGSGFEDRPALLNEIASRWRLLGNNAERVALVNEPESFFGTLEELGLSYPRFQFVKPTETSGWLFKKQGGAGGGHIIAADMSPEENGYYQEHVNGRPISALVLGTQKSAATLGLSEQWSIDADTPSMRYGGAVCPARLSEGLERRLSAAATEIVEAFRLIGLNSVDFLVSDEDSFSVLEVNPRPGATMDIYDDADVQLFALHVSAVLGDLRDDLPRYSRVRASAVVYAPGEIIIPSGVAWPSWSHDRPNAGERIAAHAPLCTVVAEGNEQGVTKNMVEQYSLDILDVIGTSSN